MDQQVRPIDANALKQRAMEMEVFMPYGGDGSTMAVHVSSIDAAPTLDYAPVKRGEWVKTRKHMWKQDEEWNVDTWAWERGYHNGPCCIICSASPCEHCNPDYEKLKNCHEHYICSECGRMVISPEPYCHCGARMNAKEEAHV